MDIETEGKAMQNRHLFRGKRLDNREWVEGQPLKHEQALFIVGNLVEACEEYCLPEFWHPVDPATIGQCTGLIANKSCRGESEADRLVFEGDIVAVDCYSYHEPENQYHGEVIIGVFGNSILCKSDNGEEEIIYLSDARGSYTTIYEIIGNIHDNIEVKDEK